MSLFDETLRRIDPLDRDAAAAAARRLDFLTKPRGSLGQLERLVCRYCAIRGNASGIIAAPAIAVFVADHGIAAEGVSAYPQSVTVEMLRNISSGGAAISVLARRFGYTLRVVDVGVATDTSRSPFPGVLYRRVGAGTRNFAHQPAMSPAETRRAIEIGIEIASELAGGATLIGIGEMGIANSTSAAAILSAITGLAPIEVAGRGTGLSDDDLRHKIGVISRALERHRSALTDGEAILSALGGFEIAAMAGVCLGGAALRVPVVVDGFIATAAAAAAERIFPGLFDYLFFGHQSAEGGHSRALDAMGVRPILNLAMRLGEGTGAALAMNTIDAALDLYRSMATFESAGVSEKIK